MLIYTNMKTKCDSHNCKNDAAAFFAVKGRAGRCCLCADCLKAIAGEVSAQTPPKSPKNTIKRLSDKREEEANHSGIM